MRIPCFGRVGGMSNAFSIIGLTFFITSLIYLMMEDGGVTQVMRQHRSLPSAAGDRSRVQVSCVICGDRVEQGLTMLKSLVIFTKAKPHVNIFAERRQMVNKKINQWPESVRKRFAYSVYEARYPPGINSDWKFSFRRCATLRLFLPFLLPSLDATIYVDTDIIFLHPVEDMWRYLDDFSSVQLVGMVREKEAGKFGWYTHYAKHPYYAPGGLNSGVMLMNLTRMRSFGLIEKSVKVNEDYKGKIPWADQDILNILFHFDPDRVFLLPCHWNYRAGHCIPQNEATTDSDCYGECQLAEKEGASLVHGNILVFSKPGENPVFRALYKTFQEYNFTSDLRKTLLEPLVRRIDEDGKGTLCWRKRHILIDSLRKFVNKSR